MSWQPPLGSSSINTPHDAQPLEDQATRSHNEHMEDLASPTTRKRPRLDSGEDSRESMSLGESSSSPQRSVSPKTPNDKESGSSQTLSGKVTINMKSPSQPSVTIQDISSVKELSVQELPQEEAGADIDVDVTDVTAPQPEGTGTVGAQLSNAISINSSPSQSPEIEVAEVEDMDQDPNTSRWRPLGEAFQEDSPADVVQVHEQFSLVDEFPKLRGNPDLRESLEETVGIIEKGHPHEMLILDAVKQWFAGCVNNLSQITLETIHDDREFWEDLPNIIDGVLRRQVAIQQQQGLEILMYLEEFFLDFGQLALHMLQLDTKYLKVVSENTSMQQHTECISRIYVQSLAWVLQMQSIPFYRALSRVYHSKAADLVAQICDHIAEAPLSVLSKVSEYISTVLSLLPRFPQLAQFLLPAVAVLANLMESRIERRKFGADEKFTNSAILNQTIQDSYPLFLKLDEVYQNAVTKKTPWVTAEVSENLSRHINTALRVYCDYDTSFTSKLAKDLSLDIPEVSTDETASIVIYAWKFNSLKRHIMDGRMELRVWGTETMQVDLVAIWRQKIQNNPDGIDCPLVQYLLKFLRDIRIIEYIVGVGSHPQIISRGGNIVGFFIVTNTYTDADTDIIWKAVTDGEDQRIVGEVLAMLARTIVMHPSTSTALRYLASKLLELPMNRFEQRMMDFCEQLFRTMREKFEESQYDDSLEPSHLDSTSLRICVRLIRESSTCPDISDEHKATIQIFAGAQLQKLLNSGMSESDKRDVYERCILDIGQKNEFATGSIQALNALIPTTLDSQEIRALATDYDLTALVIKESENFWAQTFEVTDNLSENAVNCRVHFLGRLIEKVPDTITPELSDTLWTKVITSGNVKSAKSLLWDMLCDATKRATSPNPFIERCFQQYLLTVSPANYSQDVISFAEYATYYEIRFNPPPIAAEKEIITLPGMERIWHFILTAPPNSIEARATSFAIEMYLDHNLIRKAPSSAAEATHISLVDRCVEQIKSAALTLKSSSGLVNPGGDAADSASIEQNIASAGLKLSRSLLFLQQLLHGLRSRPRYSPPQSTAPELPERANRGEPVEIRYQTFHESKQSQICTLQIGSLCTATELVNRLTRATGFSKFTVIEGGHIVKLLEYPEMTVQDLSLNGLLLIRSAPDSTDTTTAGRRQSLTLVDSEILKHFDDLYDLLDLDDRYAHEIYDFLIVFPPQERVKQLVMEESNNEDVIFPTAKPFKLLYSVKALSTCLRELCIEDTSIISHSTRVLVGALTRPDMAVPREDCMDLVFARHLLDCLLLCLSTKVAESITLPNSEGLVDRLLLFISTTQQADQSKVSELEAQRLICNAISVLTDASLRHPDFWNVAKQHVRFSELVFSLLLKEERQSIRRQVMEQIKTVCNYSGASIKVATLDPITTKKQGQTDNTVLVDMLSTIWDAFVHNMQNTTRFASNTQEFFSAAIAVLRSVAERSSLNVDFAQYVSHWSGIMLSHRNEEFVGREPVDHVILGFSRLLRLSFEVAGQEDTTMNAAALIDSLVNNYLFPDLSEPSNTEVIKPRIPVMNEETREELYRILLLLCRKEDNLEKVVELMSDLIPRDVTYNSSWSTDRLKMIRSPEGYAGLKNLSNTCYLNSLLTQLFMNVGFRDFMLNVNVDDPNSSQSLLSETKKIFANMQETWCKYVDPEGAVCSIRTYDNEPIDVTIQMDVDEFYNLLFDRWEAQITDPEAKRQFRSFYGGQLVQQIKSKECEHISERLEPFSAIQCDIKGKANLEASLQAYVEGEIMQGDNKYSCTSCGRHVDAVKRACLKDIPDNLIFHLKRFDFDMLTMMRSKINDEFKFPERIDMTPYKVEHLSDSGMQLDQDLFELVGVLVHSGTAESGHYYSYIRERPVAGERKSWVEFNDSDVTSFDPEKIAEQCFGGSNDFHGHTRYGKAWNAYMLFYQRVSRMNLEKDLYKPEVQNTPVHVALPLELGNHIAMENEIFIRAYCLLDPYHAYFTRCLLQISTTFVLAGAGAPRAAPASQKQCIYVALDTVDQLILRAKEFPEFDRMLSELKRAIQETPEGAWRIIEWAGDRETGLRNLILKSPPPARNALVRLFIMAVVKVQSLANEEISSGSDQEKWQSTYTDCWQCLAAGLSHLWPILYTASRSWDDYFEFLILLTAIQSPKIGILLDNGFLLKCLEMVWLDREDPKNLKLKYPEYFRLSQRGRKFSHRKLMELLAKLLEYVDLTLPPTPDDGNRVVCDGKYSLTVTESTFVFEVGRANHGELVFIKKILQHQVNPPAIRSIISIFLDAEPDANLTQAIVKVLEDGLRVSPAQLCSPYLEAAMVFCSRSSNEEQIIGIIDYIAKGVESINNSGGREHIGFFSSVISCRNDRLGKDETWFTEKVAERIPEWAPTLLIYPDRDVKSCALDMLRENLFSQDRDDLDDEARSFYVKVARELARASVEVLRRTYLTEQGQNVEAKTMDSIQVVITHCLRNYYDESNTDDADFMRQAEAVLGAIEQLSVEAPEEIASEDWDDHSGMESDSDLGMGTP